MIDKMTINILCCVDCSTIPFYICQCCNTIQLDKIVYSHDFIISYSKLINLIF